MAVVRLRCEYLIDGTHRFIIRRVFGRPKNHNALSSSSSRPLYMQLLNAQTSMPFFVYLFLVHKRTVFLLNKQNKIRTHTEPTYGYYRWMLPFLEHLTQASEMVWKPTMVCDTVMHQFHSDEKATKLRADHKKPTRLWRCMPVSVCSTCTNEKAKTPAHNRNEFTRTHTHTHRAYANTCECRAYFGMWLCEQRRQVSCDLFDDFSRLCMPGRINGEHVSCKCILPAKIASCIESTRICFLYRKTFSSLFLLLTHSH